MTSENQITYIHTCIYIYKNLREFFDIIFYPSRPLCLFWRLPLRIPKSQFKHWKGGETWHWKSIQPLIILITDAMLLPTSTNPASWEMTAQREAKRKVDLQVSGQGVPGRLSSGPTNFLDYSLQERKLPHEPSQWHTSASLTAKCLQDEF